MDAAKRGIITPEMKAVAGRYTEGILTQARTACA